MASLTEISQMLRAFSEDRKSLKEHNTPEKIIKLLKQEVQETEESLQDSTNLPSEIADLIIFSLTLANLHGINIEEEVLTKIAFNMARYQASDFNGDYEEARLKGKAREEWVKPMFYND